MRRRNIDNPCRVLIGETTTLTRRTTARLARLLTVGVLTLLLCLGIGVIYAGWPPFVGKPGYSLSGTGYAAMALGLTAVVLFGLGIALLVHHDKR
jgi:uncharacterized membrane protein YphA (DoxX/SURF4 family)